MSAIQLKICMTRCKRICRTADALKKERHTEVVTVRIVMALELSGTYPDIFKISNSLSTHTKINLNPREHVLHYYITLLCFTTAFYVVNGSREQLSLTLFHRDFPDI